MRKTVEWWRRRATWQKALIIAVAIVVVVGPFTGSGDDLTPEAGADPSTAAANATEPSDTSSAQVESSSTTSTAGGTSTPAVTADSTTTTTPTTTNAPTTTTQAPFPEFEILEEDDLSFAGAVRISVRVAVEEGTDRDGLRSIAQLLANQYRESAEYHAFNIFFYHYPQLSQDIATLGVWDDSPYGDWGRAAEVDRGDYSHHEPNDQTKEKDWSLLPTPSDIDLYVAYSEMFALMDTDPLEYPTDEDVFAAVAAERGIDVAAIEEAADAIFTWMFSEE